MHCWSALGTALMCQAGADLRSARGLKLGRVGQGGLPGFPEDIAPAGQPVLQLGSRHYDAIITWHRPCQPFYKIHLCAPPWLTTAPQVSTASYPMLVVWVSSCIAIQTNGAYLGCQHFRALRYSN